MTNDRKLHYYWHHHTEYEFTVCRNGSGEAHIGDIIYSFRNPVGFFISPKTDHTFISRGQFDGWIIQIPPLVFDQYRGRPEFHFLMDFLGRSSPALGFSGKASAKIVKILEKAQEQEGVFRWICLMEAFFEASQDRQARLFSFLPVSRLDTPHPDSSCLEKESSDSTALLSSGMPNKSKGDIIDEVISYIFDKFADSHKLEDLAQAAGMPLQSFCRNFKKRTSMTVVEYLHSVRINNAKKLLQQSKFYVDDICYEVGFNSVSFFNRKFKEHTGMTPMEYRRHFGGA